MWVENDDDIDRAKLELTGFLKAAGDVRYDAQDQAKQVRDEQEKKHVCRVKLKLPVPVAMPCAKPEFGAATAPGSTASVEKKTGGKAAVNANALMRKSEKLLPE